MPAEPSRSSQRGCSRSAMSCLRQRRDRHRAFALAVDLRQPRPEAVERLERILDIHRRAAPDDRAQIGRIGAAAEIEQPLHHRGRGEHRHVLPRGEQAEDLVRLERAGLRHDVDPHPRHMRHHVEAGAVAHRRGVQDRVAGRGRVHLGQIRKARLREIAMGEHRALRPAGGARGIEQPGEIVARARLDRRRIGGEQRVIFVAADDDQPLEARRRMRRDLLVEAAGREAHARAGMLEDVAELAPVQLGVRRHRREAAVPDAVNGLEILDAVLRDDRDAIAGLQSERAQAARQPRRALGELPVGLDDARPLPGRRRTRMAQAGARKPGGDVHRPTPR